MRNSGSLRLVQVVWQDAHDAYPQWTPVGAPDGSAGTILSVGWLVDPAPKAGFISLATSVDPETDHVGGGIHIPLVNLVSVTELKPAARPLPKSAIPKHRGTGNSGACCNSNTTQSSKGKRKKS